mmetsp:Transcript_25079/g.57367  ORF Transcript_25079/g.57367 Transcript_25079/m.57367 type:complete len:279 (+) Transcript_25079:280-1116(+)
MATRRALMAFEATKDLSIAKAGASPLHLRPLLRALQVLRRSEVEPLGRALFLLVHDVIARLAELSLRHLHPSLAQGEEPRLGAHRFDVGARQLVLGHDKLLEVHVLRKVHLRRVYLEDVPAGLLVRRGELYLAIDAPWSDERGVECLDLVRRQDHLHVCPCVEAVQLVEQLEHRALDLALAAGGRVVPLGSHRVDLVDEDNRGCLLVCHAEELSDELWSVSEVLLDELGPRHSQEGGRRLVGDGLGEQSLACARLSVQDHPLRRLDPNVLVELRVCER